MIVSQIAAMAKNRVIGKNNTLPWELPEDMKFFRDTTKNKIIIMGRKTFDSLGKPLPNRYNIVVTRDQNYKAPGAFVVHSIKEAIETAKAQIPNYSEEVFVIGGEQIYRQALPYTDRIYLTEIDQTFDGEAKYPEFDTNVFKLVSRTERTEPFKFAFCTYQKILNP